MGVLEGRLADERGGDCAAGAAADLADCGCRCFRSVGAAEVVSGLVVRLGGADFGSGGAVRDRRDCRLFGVAIVSALRVVLLSVRDFS